MTTVVSTSPPYHLSQLDHEDGFVGMYGMRRAKRRVFFYHGGFSHISTIVSRDLCVSLLSKTGRRGAKILCYSVFVYLSAASNLLENLGRRWLPG